MWEVASESMANEDEPKLRPAKRKTISISSGFAPGSTERIEVSVIKDFCAGFNWRFVFQHLCFG